jgi:hypothetical protein
MLVNLTIRLVWMILVLMAGAAGYLYLLHQFETDVNARSALIPWYHLFSSATYGEVQLFMALLFGFVCAISSSTLSLTLIGCGMRYATGLA